MPRRVLEGRVVSDKMDKTVTVLVERRFMHPKYKKYLKRSTKYAVHDEQNACKEGDKVQIIECAPISKRKSWTVVDGVNASSAPAVEKKEKAPAKKAEAKKAPVKKAAAKKTAKKAPAKKAAAKKTAKKED